MLRNSGFGLVGLYRESADLALLVLLTDSTRRSAPSQFPFTCKSPSYHPIPSITSKSTYSPSFFKDICLVFPAKLLPIVLALIRIHDTLAAPSRLKHVTVKTTLTTETETNSTILPVSPKPSLYDSSPVYSVRVDTTRDRISNAFRRDWE